jgi:hypothetical protein
LFDIETEKINETISPAPSFISIGRLCAGQDLYDRISDKMCTCLERKNAALDSARTHKCLDKIFDKFTKELIKYHELNTIGELDMEEFMNTMWGRLAKNCKYMTNTFKDTIAKYNPQFVPDTKPVCDSIHTGEFYYVEYNSKYESYDTTFATFSREEYLEKIQPDNTYSRLSIKWISDCRYQLTFIESNDPFKKSFSKRGDTYIYEIRKVTADSFIVEYIWDGPKVFIEYVRAK